MIEFSKIIGVDWDDGNLDKNLIKHKVYFQECEELFFNDPLLVFDDVKHSQKEERYFALGKANSNKYLFIVFTIILNKIRVISARSMNKNEKKQYEK